MSNSVHSLGGKSYGPYDYPLGDELRGERATLGKSLLDIQRDLRIKAAYIAAIEDAKPDVFPNPSFIAGYVRSYARYLSLDPDEIFHRFCLESGFVGSAGRAPSERSHSTRGAAAASGVPSGFRPDFAIARLERRQRLPQISLPGIGSVLVLMALITGLGYGGWTVLQNIQRVQFAPVDDLPAAVAEVAPLDAPDAATLEEPALADLASPVAATALADLYRQQELEVPILMPRDGPIAALDPDRTGLLAVRSGIGGGVETAAAEAEVPTALIGPPVAEAAGSEPQVTSTVERPTLVVVAERAAWVRVYQQNGTIIFEKILEKGETYTPPDGVADLRIWAGNSGSVYVRVGDSLHGPLGSGTRAAKDVVLEPQAIVDRFAVVQDVPEVISQSLGARTDAGGPAVAIR